MFYDINVQQKQRIENIVGPMLIRKWSFNISLRLLLY